MIYEMENTPVNKSRWVQAWDYDYKMLKHIRWVRNKIAHCEGSSECTKNDIIYVKQFYQRIIKQEDPFSILYKRNSELSKYVAVHNNKASYKEIKYSNDNKAGNIDLFGCFLIIILIILISMMLWLK